MDLQRFLNASLAPREVTIKVPELAEFFGEDDPKWTVRGLTAAELGRANESAERGPENIKALIAAMAGDGNKAEAIRKSMGLSDQEVPHDVSRRIEILSAGSVSPSLGINNRDVAVKLAETFPTTFYNLTNQIINLTGQGADMGKPRRSGKAAKSDQ
jgi:hypothetical protein